MDYDLLIDLIYCRVLWNSSLQHLGFCLYWIIFLEFLFPFYLFVTHILRLPANICQIPTSSPFDQPTPTILSIVTSNLTHPTLTFMIEFQWRAAKHGDICSNHCPHAAHSYVFCMSGSNKSFHDLHLRQRSKKVHLLGSIKVYSPMSNHSLLLSP